MSPANFRFDKWPSSAALWNASGLELSQRSRRFRIAQRLRQLEIRDFRLKFSAECEIMPFEQLKRIKRRAILSDARLRTKFSEYLREREREVYDLRRHDLAEICGEGFSTRNRHIFHLFCLSFSRSLVFSSKFILSAGQ